MVEGDVSIGPVQPTIGAASSVGKPIASFPYEDVKDGIGLQTLYGYVQVITGGTVNYYLGPNIVYSSYIELDEVTINSSPTTLTFYGGAFNRPRTLFGTFSLNFCWSHSGAGTNYVSVKLYHYDGATSTQLGSTWVGKSVTGARTSTENATISVTSAKRFKQGEQIKVEVIITSDGITQAWVGVDPQNRDGGVLTPSTVPSETTQMIARVPFKIDY